MATETARLEPSSDQRVTAGSWVGAHAPSVVEPHRKRNKTRETDTDPRSVQANPKHQPPPGNRNSRKETLEVQRWNATTCESVVAAAKSHSSGSTPFRTLSTGQSITKYKTCRQDTKNDGWQMSYSSPPPSVVALGARRLPTIGPITKLTMNCPADSGPLVQGTEVPEERGGYLLKCRSFGRRPREGKQRKSQPHQPAPGTNEPGAPAPSQTSDSHQEAQPSATGKIGTDSLDRGPTSLPRGSWNVMSAATQKPRRNF